jgi:hypothetical protein
LRQQNASLTEESNQLAKIAIQPKVSPQTNAVEMTSGQFSELLRLRGRVGGQREKLKKLRAQLVAKESSAAARASALTNYFPKESWATAGFATPAAAVQSGEWMSRHRAEKEDDTANDSDPQAKLIAELIRSANDISKLDGLRIVSQQTLSNDEVSVRYLIFSNHGTNDGWVQARLKYNGSEWR